jgi:predicted RNase H-like HicB family nuclease
MAQPDLKHVVWKEGKHYVSWNLNTGVASFGATRKEALACLQEALELYFEDTPRSRVQRVERPDIVRGALAHA